jgi:hypothetical protein
VSGNEIKSSTLTHNIYVFSELTNNVSGGSLVGNSFKDAALAKASGNNLAFGPDGYSYAFDVIEANQGINTKQTGTPVFSGSTVAGAGTYSTQLGTYTRVNKDDIVFDIDATWTGHTGTGGMVCSLPTDIKNTSLGGVRTTAPAITQNIALTNTKWPTAMMGAPAGNITFYEYQSAGGVGLVTMSAAGTVWLSGRYAYRNLV